MLVDVQTMRPGECSSRKTRAVRRRKSHVVWSKEVEDLSQIMSASRTGISPSARAALMALIATLADLLGEPLGA